MPGLYLLVTCLINFLGFFLVAVFGLVRIGGVAVVGVAVVEVVEEPEDPASALCLTVDLV